MYPIIRLAPLLLLAATPLHAQEPAVPRDTVSRFDTAVVRLPEVTVTATRAPARILDVPLAAASTSARAPSAGAAPSWARGW